MTTYRLEYGDDQDGTVDETIDADHVEREDGWIVFMKDGDAVARLQEDHVKNLFEIPAE